MSSSSSPVKMSEVSSPGVDYSQREGDSLIDYEEHTSSSLRLLNMSASVCVAFVIYYLKPLNGVCVCVGSRMCCIIMIII